MPGPSVEARRASVLPRRARCAARSRSASALRAAAAARAASSRASSDCRPCAARYVTRHELNTSARQKDSESAYALVYWFEACAGAMLDALFSATADKQDPCN